MFWSQYWWCLDHSIGDTIQKVLSNKFCLSLLCLSYITNSFFPICLSCFVPNSYIAFNNNRKVHRWSHCHAIYDNGWVGYPFCMYMYFFHEPVGKCAPFLACMSVISDHSKGSVTGWSPPPPRHTPSHRPESQTPVTDPGHRPRAQAPVTDPGHRPGHTLRSQTPVTGPSHVPGHRPESQTPVTGPSHRPRSQTADSVTLTGHTRSQAPITGPDHRPWSQAPITGPDHRPCVCLSPQDVYQVFYTKYKSWASYAHDAAHSSSFLVLNLVLKLCLKLILILFINFKLNYFQLKKGLLPFLKIQSIFLFIWINDQNQLVESALPSISPNFP